MTLYKFRLAPHAQSLEDAHAIDRLRYGWDYLEQAISLWRLVDSARAVALAELVDRVSSASDGPTCFAGDDLAALTQMITGIEDAIRAAGIIDRHGRVPAEHLAALKRAVPAMDLETERTLEDKTNALLEVIGNADGLHEFLSEALRDGCVVVNN
jgi:hypothetical protein